MNCFYKEMGAKVLVKDENEQVRELDNKANIEAILLLENDKLRVEKLVGDYNEKKSEAGSDLKKYIKYHHSFISATGAVCITALTGKFILPIINPNFYLETGPLSLFGVVSTAVLLHTKGVGYHEWKNDNLKIKLKNANLLNFAIDRELKVERKAVLPNNRITEFKDISNCGLVKFNILDYYEKKHDDLIKNFKEKHELPCYKDKLSERLISDMLQKEIYDEESNNEKIINTKAIKEKVKKIFK